MTKPEEMIEVREWFACDVPRNELKGFYRKDNYHAALFYATWLILLVASGYLAYKLYPTPWAIPAFFLYGVIYCGCNPRWHEASHQTAFKAIWINDFFYFLCGVMELRDYVDFRWSHSRHHSYTIMTGIDPEIAVPRPPNLLFVLLDFFYLRMGFLAARNLVLNSLGIVPRAMNDYVPETELRRLGWSARSVLAIYLALILWAVLSRSWLPVLFFVFPRFYGAPFIWSFICLQHVGLAENVWDHRLSTRSLRLNFLLSFLFMNMESHVEHHIYPLVPFHALPRLRERVKNELPTPYRGLRQGAAELFPVLLRQRKDITVHIKRPLPPRASG